MGLFGDLFDFNHNKKTDPFERALEFTLFDDMERERKTKKAKVRQEEAIAELDEEELELMDEDERREALEDAGLAPDDYIF